MLWQARKDAGRTWICRLGDGLILILVAIKEYSVANAGHLLGGVLRRLKRRENAGLKHRTHSSTRSISLMSEQWVVEWHRYTLDDGSEKWSSMTFPCERRANTFAQVVQVLENTDDVIILGPEEMDREMQRVVPDSPHHATIFAMVTWDNTQKTIHWNIPNDVIALWMALDRYGNPEDAERIQVCESEKDGFDLKSVMESLIDFSFDSGDEYDEL